MLFNDGCHVLDLAVVAELVDDDDDDDEVVLGRCLSCLVTCLSFSASDLLAAVSG